MLGRPEDRSRDRIARLRGLAARLAQLPPSADRDALMREARDRLVAADTGSPPSSHWQDRRDEAVEHARRAAALRERTGAMRDRAAAGVAQRRELREQLRRERNAARPGEGDPQLGAEPNALDSLDGKP